MDRYEVTQALMTVTTVYHARRPGSDAVAFTVRGELMSPTPRFHLLEGESGTEVAELDGNFLKTRYEILAGGNTLASIVFPAVAFNKTMTLTAADGDVYEANGGVLRGVFQCRTKDGEVVLEIGRKLSFRDTFTVGASEKMPATIGILTAVAIHSRFYEMV